LACEQLISTVIKACQMRVRTRERAFAHHSLTHLLVYTCGQLNRSTCQNLNTPKILKYGSIFFDINMCTEKECSRKCLVKGKMQGSYYSDRLCLHIDMPWQQELHDFPVLQVCCEASLSFCTLSRSHSHSGTCLIRLAALLQRSLFREISSEQQVNGRNRTVKNQKDRRNTQELFNNIVNRKEIQNTRKAE